MDSKRLEEIRKEMADMTPQDRERMFEQLRREEVEKDIIKRFRQIFTKGHMLTRDDKSFLQARASYLTDVEKKEYEKELAENLTSEQGEVQQEQENPLKLMTRKELEAILQVYGIQDTSAKVYRTNPDLITAIEEIQAQKA